MPPEQADAAVESTVAEEPVETAAAEPAEGDADGAAADIAEDGGDPAAGAPEDQRDGSEPEPEPAPKKSATARLQGRIGHLTKTLHEKDTELARERSQREALEALLNRSDGEATPAPTAAAPAPGTAEFDRLVDERATHKARAEAFTRDCNTIFDAGVGKHGKDAFEEAVTNLNVLGLMDETLVEAAMATDAPADVIHFLGSDVDEAARIRALPPIRMAAEIVKLSTTLAKPKEEPQISRAPAPITPVNGGQQASLDVADPNISMAEYVRRRKAQGSRWAR